MKKHWKIADVDLSRVDELSNKFNIPKAIAALLAQKDIDFDLDTFLSTKLDSNFNDSYPRIPDVFKAVDRMWEAINSNEKVVIYGDYDCDGITSTALLTRALTSLGMDVNPFIPSRLHEGYGFGKKALDRCIMLHNPSLIITVDCGVNSGDAVEYAESKNIDVIITDHHEPSDEMASPYALVNPKLSKDEDIRFLAGVGVAFLLSFAMYEIGRKNGQQTCNKYNPTELLDLAAFGTVADMVPLTHINRKIVKIGLNIMDFSKNKGIQALKKLLKITGNIAASNIGFGFGPRINAAGRIGDPADALSLLTTECPRRAYELAEKLDKMNNERKNISKEISEYVDEVVRLSMGDGAYGIVVANSGWHPGIVGIVASNIVEKYNRPTIILNVGMDGIASGSCRSIPSFDLLAGLDSCSDLLIKYGGHKAAAGLSLQSCHIGEFTERFNEFCKVKFSSIDITPVINYDAEVTITELADGFYTKLQKLAPFGMDNHEPIFKTSKVTVISKRSIGDNHMKLVVTDGKTSMDAIMFNYDVNDLPPGQVDIVFNLNMNVFRGVSALQLMIKDIR